ncbi:MAG: hypothetical protein L6R38_009604 [Xanthoria sp. 2 TBL-2021]|nr:MAG: hypothetical protein L6R38_009604 [Xanthoria sp. 2 TBL-2021]
MARTSKRLIASYILDWVIILAIAAVGAGFWKVTPNHRPFTLVDPSISFPHVEHEKISTAVLAVVSLIFPAITIFLVAMIFVPGPSGLRWAPFGQTLRRKLWEWNTGWLGLGLSLALSFVLTQGMKNLFGKPRPDLLSRCDPDYENQAEYALGGYPLVLNGLYLVSSTICRQTDKGMLNDGFSSFPSGHSSYSFAGLTYLALYLASKFSITVPYLLPFSYTSSSSSNTTFANDQKPTRPDSSSPTLPTPSSSTQRHQTPLRSQSAAPPVYLLLLPFIPICLAIYVSSTRYSDFRHHGFDILFSSLMGIVLSWFSFRMYHLPIRRGGGWSWGPRSEGKAFGTLLGTGGYRETGRKRDDDVGGQRADLEWGKGPTGREGNNSQETSGDYVNGTVEPSTSVR